MHRVVNLGKCLADPGLIRILMCLIESDLDIAQLQDVLRMNRSQIDQRLTKLRDLGIVRAERSERWLRFGLAPEYAPMVRYLLQDFDADVEWNEQVTRDATRLKQQLQLVGRSIA